MTALDPAEALPRTRLGRLWLRPSFRGLVWQALAVSVVGGALAWLAANIQANLTLVGLGIDFSFLGHVSRFFMGDNPLDYQPGDTIAYAFAAGIVNTIRVSILAILLTTVLGTAVALMRLSRNWLVAKVSFAYVETMRNIPLLLHLLFWHAVITLSLPNSRQAWRPVEGVFLSNKGLMLPAVVMTPTVVAAAIALVAGCVAALVLRRISVRRRQATGRANRLTAIGLALVPLLPAVAWLAGGEPLTLDMPVAKGLSLRGGLEMTPEFVALLFALTIYQSAFTAETIRSGILGVRKGQIEAARSLGLPPWLILTKVVMPQALRIIVPPLTSQYLTLTKQSSLAVAVGYPDVVRVSLAITTETSRVVECLLILVSVYLTLSLLTALFMNWYNRRIAYVER